MDSSALLKLIVSAGVGAVGGVAAVLGLSRWLGEVWLGRILEKEKAKHAKDLEGLKAGFSQELEQFKHGQQKELEQVRHDMNTAFSRISKIHDKEFEILPRAWQLLQEANGAVFNVVKALKQFPDFSRMSEPQFEEFLKACRLADFKKNELRDAKDRDECYSEALFWLELDDAKKARTELNNYLAVNSIFMTENLRQQFSEINRALAELVISEEVAHGQGYSAEIQKSISENLDKISERFDKIEQAVQKRLRYEEA
jgi:hypothetical protein